jgi:hypothetical protein
MIEAVNTCPKWGVIHSVQSKVFTVGYRQMALEAGSLMHEVFSVLNLFQVGAVQGLYQHMDYAAAELFTEERWNIIKGDTFDADKSAESDQRTLERLAIRTIGSSDYYDDPEDKNRTISNLEHCSLELINYWLMNMRDYNIFISDRDDPTAPIGIELSLDVVFDCVEDSGETPLVRLIGLIDAVYQNTDTSFVTTGEYKTASSMNDAWREAFKTRHQITGYQAALRAYHDAVLCTGNTIMLGSAIPVRKTTAPVQHFMIERDDEHTRNFLNTCVFTKRIIEEYNDGDKSLQAPMFTHSCNRYFRPCSQIDLCASAFEDQEVMYEQMLQKPELSPSEVKAFLQNG